MQQSCRHLVQQTLYLDGASCRCSNTMRWQACNSCCPADKAGSSDTHDIICVAVAAHYLALHSMVWLLGMWDGGGWGCHAVSSCCPCHCACCNAAHHTCSQSAEDIAYMLALTRTRQHLTVQAHTSINVSAPGGIPVALVCLRSTVHHWGLLHSHWVNEDAEHDA